MKEQAPSVEVAIYQLVKGRLLVGVFAVPYAPFIRCSVFLCYVPGPLAIDQLLVTEGDGHFKRKVIAKDIRVHLFQVAHGRPLCSGSWKVKCAGIAGCALFSPVDCGIIIIWFAVAKPKTIFNAPLRQGSWSAGG